MAERDPSGASFCWVRALQLIVRFKPVCPGARAISVRHGLMEPREYFSILRQRWLTAAIVTLLTVGAAAAVILSIPPKYTATTELFFGLEGGDSVSDLAQASSFTQLQ